MLLFFVVVAILPFLFCFFSFYIFTLALRKHTFANFVCCSVYEEMSHQKKKPAKTRKYDIRSCIDNSKNGISAEYKCRRCHSNPSHAFLSETFTFFFHFNLRTMLMCTHPKLYDSLDRETIETNTYTRFQYMSGWSACGVTSTNCDWWLKQFRSIKFGCNRNPSLSFYSQSIVIIISIFFIHRL